MYFVMIVGYITRDVHRMYVGTFPGKRNPHRYKPNKSKMSCKLLYAYVYGDLHKKCVYTGCTLYKITVPFLGKPHGIYATTTQIPKL